LNRSSWHLHEHFSSRFIFTASRTRALIESGANAPEIGDLADQMLLRKNAAEPLVTTGCPAASLLLRER
jgi:hypothetical protein